MRLPAFSTISNYQPQHQLLNGKFHQQLHSKTKNPWDRSIYPGITPSTLYSTKWSFAKPERKLEGKSTSSCHSSTIKKNGFPEWRARRSQKLHVLTAPTWTLTLLLQLQHKLMQENETLTMGRSSALQHIETKFCWHFPTIIQ